MEFTFAPIYSLGRNGSADKFDLRELPFAVQRGLTIENVEHLLPQDAFDLWKAMLGESLSEKVGKVKHALVHRYEMGDDRSDFEESSTVFATSCLRLIRPMRQGVLAFARGQIREDGGFDVTGFDLSERPNGVEVVEAHKLSTLRYEDALSLRLLIPEFIRAMKGEFWKFRMAVQFHDLGYFQLHWKPKFLLWTSALESIFTSHSREHQGSRVAVARINWFLGEKTRIYPPRDWPSAVPDCTLTLGDVLNDLYELRNYVAHGDKVPDSFFNTFPRTGINGGISKVEVLCETASLVIRASLIKILRERLLDQFADAKPAEGYFGAQGLVNSKL
jgi:hypothetical protein